MPPSLHFADHLTRVIEAKESVLCLGLDPHYDRIPEFLKKDATPDEVMLKFFVPIIEACHEYIACVKPQLAFFEAFGSTGFAAFEKLCMYAKSKGLIVIADAKRGDIGSTAEAYAEAFLGKGRPYDALTVNPYLGQDGVLPFVEKCQENQKGIFVLAKTSNPSSGEFQDLMVGEELVHEVVARSIASWGAEDLGELGYSSVGAVVGATYSDEMHILRNEMPGQIFLVPGYGAQGGSAEDIAPAFFAKGRGAIVNSSRGILFAFEDQEDPKNFVQYALNSCIESKNELWGIATSV